MPYVGRKPTNVINADALNNVYPVLVELFKGVGMHIATETLSIITGQVTHANLNALLLSQAGAYQYGDVDNDGDVDISDSVDVLRWVVGLEDDTPKEAWIQDKIITEMLKNYAQYSDILDFATSELVD